jgi:hypothetical protein
MSSIKAHVPNSKRFTEVSHQVLHPLDLTEVTLAEEFGRRVECASSRIASACFEPGDEL